MGNRSSKSSLRNAIIRLTISADSVRLHDEVFWSQILSEDMYIASEIIKSISVQEVRMLRDGSPRNFATLTYKLVETLCSATGTLCNTLGQQTYVINAARILTRLMPCIFEDEDWSNFFEVNYLNLDEIKSQDEPRILFPNKKDEERNYTYYLPSNIQADISHGSTLEGFESYQTKGNNRKETSQNIDQRKLISREDDLDSNKLIYTLMSSICNLLFCPEFTVVPQVEKYLNRIVDAPPQDVRSLSTCDYVWEPGVGFDCTANSTTSYDKNRAELLRLLLVCFSSILYQTPTNSLLTRNKWIDIFASAKNRHALPLFTSFLNTTFSYKQSKSIPFNYLLFEDSREELVELCIQILICTLEDQILDCSDTTNNERQNMFIEYTSRIHRSEDLAFMVKGFKRMLNSRFEQGSFIQAAKSIDFEQELLILFWRLCNLNSRFLSIVLTAGNVLEITVPILYHLNENFRKSSKITLVHICIFNLLILSGERNFGVMLNKPYTTNLLGNIPTFSGSHADLLIIVIHKLILYGENFDQLIGFLMTIIVNISPFLKTITILASKCLIQLFEIFSSPYVIFTEPNYHKVIVFLLEIFNNLIQYQFDGNVNLVYVILNKKETFIELANLTCTVQGIQKVIRKLIRKKRRSDQNEKLDLEQGSSQPSCVEKQEELDKQIHLNYSTLKQEVNLVALPDIFNVVQTVYPFECKDFRKDEKKGTSHSLDKDLNQRVENLLLVEKVDEELSSTKKDEKNVETENEHLSSLINEHSSSLFEDASNYQLIERTNPIESQAGTNKWRPTPEWVKEWKATLPLHTTLRLIEVLEPQLEHIKQNSLNKNEETEIITFLQNGTLVGLLPLPHPIQIRKYRINKETDLWFRCCTWGVIYTRSTIWTNTHVRLIRTV